MYTLEQCITDIKTCDMEIAKAKQILDHSPEGTIVLNKTKNRIFWYKYDSKIKKHKYITRSQKGLAEKLAAKRIASFRENYYSSRKKALLTLKNELAKATAAKEDFVNNNSELYILASPYVSAPPSLSAWVKEEYDQNTKHPETLIFKTLNGDFVRSKSECMIADALYMKEIPYRYECKLQLKHMTATSPYEDGNHSIVTLYPDFTIKHPITGKIIIWEHFGLITDPNYAANTISKLQLYTNNGYMSNLNLITTYETPVAPLDSATINEIIEKMFR